MDQRSQPIVERIQQDESAVDLIFRETLNFPSTTYTAPHVRWVIENQPEMWAETTQRAGREGLPEIPADR